MDEQEAFPKHSKKLTNLDQHPNYQSFWKKLLRIKTKMKPEI